MIASTFDAQLAEAQSSVKLAEARAAKRQIERRAHIDAIYDWGRLLVAMICACLAIVCGAMSLVMPDLIRLTQEQAYYAIGGGLGFFNIKPAWFILKKVLR